jgi:hypothetical protein
MRFEVLTDVNMKVNVFCQHTAFSEFTHVTKNKKIWGLKSNPKSIPPTFAYHFNNHGYYV